MIRGVLLSSSTLLNVSARPVRLFSEQVAAAAAAKPVRKSLKKMANRPIIVEQRSRNSALESKAAESKLGWRIVGATILQRYPIITKDAEQWEIDMWAVQDEINDKKREYVFEKIGGTDAQLITEMNPTYQEILDSMPFKPASRTTEADINNDRRSVDRRLQDSLFLIVKRSRDDKQWQFPQGKLVEGETMRLASERVIDRAIGKTKRYFISNAPIGHYCYEYPKSLQEKRGNFGAKVFFNRAQLLSGTIKLQTKLYTDYAWIARDEVHEYFDEDTANYLKYLLLD